MNKPALKSAAQFMGLCLVAFAGVFFAMQYLGEWLGKWAFAPLLGVILILVFLIEYERAKVRKQDP